MDRDIRDALSVVRDAETHLKASLLASDTRTMAREADASLALIDDVLDEVKSVQTQDTESTQGGSADLLNAAAASLNRAWVSSEKVGMADNLEQMRSAVLDVLTHTHYADAFLHACVGWLEE